MRPPRLGSAMRAALEYVQRCGGVAPCKLPVARAIASNPDTVHVYYQAVDRCIDAGWLRLELGHPRASKNSRGAVVITPEGVAKLYG